MILTLNDRKFPIVLKQLEEPDPRIPHGILPTTIDGLLAGLHDITLGGSLKAILQDDKIFDRLSQEYGPSTTLGARNDRSQPTTDFCPPSPYIVPTPSQEQTLPVSIKFPPQEISLYNHRQSPKEKVAGNLTSPSRSMSSLLELSFSSECNSDPDVSPSGLPAKDPSRYYHGPCCDRPDVRLSPQECIPGRIVWVKVSRNTKNKRRWLHPFVILRVDDIKDEITLLLITSFGNKLLSEKHSDSPTRNFSHYLSIASGTNVFDSGAPPELRLQAGKKLQKRCYVEYDNPHRVAFHTLRKYEGEDYLLEHASLSYMVAESY